jgi:hypothetical protein
MQDKGKRLDCLTKIGWEVRNEFRTRIEAAHPWLRLCEGHWKADQLWSNHFSGWTPAAESKGKRAETLKRERSDEGDKAGPSEKKTKTLAEQPARPKPTKKLIAKVSLPIPSATLS